MAEHVLKCRINDWDTIADGRKRIELRKDDRGFEVADLQKAEPIGKRKVTGFLDKSELNRAREEAKRHYEG